MSVVDDDEDLEWHRGPDPAEVEAHNRPRDFYHTAKIGNAYGAMPSHMLMHPETGNIYERTEPNPRTVDHKAVAKRRAKNKAKRRHR